MRVLENTVHPQGEGHRVVRCPALHLAASGAGTVPKKKKKKKKVGVTSMSSLEGQRDANSGMPARAEQPGCRHITDLYT